MRKKKKIRTLSEESLQSKMKLDIKQITGYSMGTIKEVPNFNFNDF
tara:strand:- start:46 stop:183 length:138 start_codon:yes stop_codon:yes gene_type:complete